MAESTALEFEESDGKYVAKFTAEAETTAVQVIREEKGLLQVYISLDGSTFVLVKSWSKNVIPGSKVFNVCAPIGATVRIASVSAVTESYTMPYDAE